MNASKKQESCKRIGVALSGGGFRATLFHLGAVRALQACGLLKKVTDISCVSGGSMLGAHLVLNWEDYNDPKTFKARADEIIAFSKTRDVRGRILRRLPWITLARGITRGVERLLRFVLPDWSETLERWADCLTATGLLELECRRLFERKTLNDLNTRDSDSSASKTVPELYILATNITTVKPCFFCRDGFRLDGEPNTRPIGKNIIDVAEAVAASSAHPAFFPPVKVPRKRLPWPENRELSSLFVLDGGVYDNLGVHRFAQDNLQVDVVIVSDATGRVDLDTNPRIRAALTSAMRAIDIIAIRTRDLQRQALDASETDKSLFVFVDIRRDDLTGPQALDDVLQERLAFIRTDFDRFNETEIASLIDHGYAVCRSALEQAVKDKRIRLRRKKLRFEPFDKDWPVPRNRRQPVKRANRILERAKTRHWRVVRISDWITYVNGVVLLIILLALAFALGSWVAPWLKTVLSSLFSSE